MLMLDTFFYFIIFTLSFFSFIGYGIFYQNIICNQKNKIDNIFNYSFLGLIILLPLSFFNYLILGNIIWINLIFIVFGIFFTIRNLSIKDSYLVILFSIIFFSGILISKTHEDFSVYHFQHVKELSDGFIKLGLGNLDQRYIYSSNFSYLQLIFQLPFFGLKLINIPSFLIYVSLIGYLFCEIKNTKSSKRFLSLFFLILLMLKFKRFSEFGYDYIGQFVLIYLFIEYVFNSKSLNIIRNINFNSIFLICVLIKISNLYFFPIVLFITYINHKNLRDLFLNKISLFFSLLIILVFISNSYIKTGCFNYLLKDTCMSVESTKWVINYNKVEYTKKIVKNWTKGYYLQRKNVLSEKDYNKNFNWVNHWIKIHFLVKILDYLLVITSIFLICRFVIIDKTKIENQKKVKNFLLNTSIFFSFFLWFSQFPQFRFGIFGITAIFFILLNSLFKMNNNVNDKKFLVLFLISIIYFNFINISRIIDDSNRDDIYKYSNFPWFVFPELSFKKEKINEIIVFRSSKNKDFWRTCWNVPSVCINHDEPVDLIQKGRFIFIKDLNPNKKFF